MSDSDDTRAPGSESDHTRKPAESLSAGLANWKENSWKRNNQAPKLRPPNYRPLGAPPLPDLSLPSDSDLNSYDEKLGYPGLFPYTRGVHSTMYRGRLWTMRQYAGFGTAVESNQRYRYLLDQGTTGLSVAFDLPTQMGHDSDSAKAMGEVGRVGVAIDSIADMALLFDQIPLDSVSTSMTINATASTLLAFYAVVAERQGVPMSAIRGTVQNDILKEYIARGTYIYPPRPSMRIITDMFAFCSQHIPNWNTVSVSGYHIREAGSTAGQEIGFTLADGIAYVQAAIDTGLEVDVFAPRISFFFNVHNNFLEEIAKFRATRRLWAKIMRERFGAKHPKSLMVRFHSQTAGSTLTAQQPDVNVVRVTIQALASVLGGTQSLHTNSRDEALALPSEESVTLALRTQQVIAHESGVVDYSDPLGGSYVIEALTDQLEAEATGYIAQIDQLGGAVAAIEEGYQQDLIHEAAYDYQTSIERDTAVVVGMNRFVRDNEKPPENLLRIDQRVQDQQIARLRGFKASRSMTPVSARLAELKTAALGSDNLMPRIINCVKDKVTLGEVANTLRDVFGEFHG